MSLILSLILATGVLAAPLGRAKPSRLNLAGPFTFLMTEEESRAWATMPVDADVSDFVEVFWARRDPTPGTVRNEFREQFEARVTYADVNFSEWRRGTRTSGSMTDRGKAYILFGQPTRKTLIARGPSFPATREGLPKGIDAFPQDARRGETWIWTYEGVAAQQAFGSSPVELQFEDQRGSANFRLQAPRFDVHAAEQHVIKAAITRPDLKWVPK